MECHRGRCYIRLSGMFPSSPVGDGVCYASSAARASLSPTSLTACYGAHPQECEPSHEQWECDTVGPSAGASNFERKKLMQSATPVAGSRCLHELFDFQKFSAEPVHKWRIPIVRNCQPGKECTCCGTNTVPDSTRGYSVVRASCACFSSSVLGRGVSNPSPL